MPNWVTSKLKIEGPNSSRYYEEFISFNDAKEVYFDFNKITPMPDELNIVSGSLTDRSNWVVFNINKSRCKAHWY